MYINVHPIHKYKSINHLLQAREGQGPLCRQVRVGLRLLHVERRGRGEGHGGRRGRVHLLLVFFLGGGLDVRGRGSSHKTAPHTKK